tara:strand:- start:387 stop:752 length:366 start_codon:yes stop_codon:yes gene_type:complete
MEGSLIIENTENHLEVEMVEKDNKMGSKEKKECDCDEKSDKKKCDECDKDDRTNLDKWKYTLITTVLFFIVINPYTYKFVHFLLKRFFKIADKTGCPTFAGVLVHTLVFTLLLRGLMELKL